MTRKNRLVILLTLAASACAPADRPPVTAPVAAPTPGQVYPVIPNPPPGRPDNAPSPTPASAPTPRVPDAPSPTPAASRPKRPVKTPTGTAPKSAATAPDTQAMPPPAASKPDPKSTAQTLDLASLEQRLRDTKAIGVFTKLSLKNQVDDLLDEVRQYHQSSGKSSQPAIRQQFEGLILKVLSSLQSGDPQLANTIASSREALWGILMDPVKFSKI